MKIAKWLLYSVALLLLVFFAASCKKKNEKEFKPSPLAAELHSGESLEAVERKLHMMAGSFDILHDRTPLPSDTRPPYRLLVISARTQTIWGQRGVLEMTFFNDQLMTMQFYPEDLAAFVRAVEGQQKLSLSGGSSHIEPSTRVWVGKDAEGRSYVGWIDKSLQSDQDAWNRQYGQ